MDLTVGSPMGRSIDALEAGPPANRLPVSSAVVRAVIASICRRPYKGDDKWPDCSIGVADNSVVATNGNSAIVIGKVADGHSATQLKEVLIECERAKQYGKPIELDSLPKLVDEKTGEVTQMPPIQKLVRAHLGAMKPVGAMNPKALMAIGKVATAAGASSVELFQPEGDATVLGFRFEFAPEPGHVDLWHPWEGMILASGVFIVTQGASRVEEDDEEMPDPYASDADDGETLAAPPSASEVVSPAAATRSTGDLEGMGPEGLSTPCLLLSPERKEEVSEVDLSSREQRGAYLLPALSLLDSPDGSVVDTGDYGGAILGILRDFNLQGRIAATRVGPRVTMYEIEVPKGTKAKDVQAVGTEIQMGLEVTSLRIQAPIPGRNAIGVEVPNRVPRTVRLSELCATAEFLDPGVRLKAAIGLDVGGRAVFGDLAKMPHLLIAGATGSGKSIGVASILASLLMRNSPAELRLVLIDPKRVELTLFEGIPHLMCPVIKDMKEAAGVLRALWREMDRRYDLFSNSGVRNVDGFNAKASENERLPYIVAVVDELADLIMGHRDEVESVIVRLAQLARAAGIHMVIATQRPSVDVITGLIKANMPSRVAFNVAQRVDSMVILDTPGAETLLGGGDMLWAPSGIAKPLRVQGVYVGEDELERICRAWRDQGAPVFTISLATAEPAAGDVDPEDVDPEDAEHPKWPGAVVWVAERKTASTSMLQRKFSIEFQTASKMLDRMEREGIVGPRDGARPREVLISVKRAWEMVGR